MGFSYNVNVLNQKGSPAIYTDTFANRPAFGFAGRLFIANDTAAIYEDTGTSWVLIANVSSGAGTLQQVTTNGNTSNVGISVTAGGVSTNGLTVTTLTTGSVPFVGAAGLITQDNTNLFFDDTNNRLGINTNTPSNNLDVHGSGTSPLIAINNTAGNQSLIGFAKNSTAKWRIGNSSTDTFDVLNVGLALNAISINGSTNTSYFNQNIAIKQNALYYNTAGFNSIGCDVNGFYFQRDTNPNNAYFDFSLLLSTRNFVFPNATGTLALTTDLASYLPLAGGTLSGNLTVNNGITFPSTQIISADPNTLDDYEEGNWTIGLNFGGGSVGITTADNSGKYTKIGRQVNVTGYINLTNKGTSIGDAQITGLPFTIGSTNGFFSASTFRNNNITFTGQFVAYGTINQATIELNQTSNLGITTTINNTNFANNSSLIISFTYFI